MPWLNVDKIDKKLILQVKQVKTLINFVLNWLKVRLTHVSQDSNLLS